MTCITFNLFGTHYALMNYTNVGFIGKGRTAGEAIDSAFSKVIAFNLK